jgi:hypothetical protein
VEAPANYHFVAGQTRTLVFGAGERPQTTLAFPKVSFCNVQDTRQWQGNVYQAFCKIIQGERRVKPGETYALSFVLRPDDRREYRSPQVKLTSQEPLSISDVALPGRPVPRCGLAVIKVDLRATYDTPFDPDQVALDGVFTSPSGKQVTAPGFFSQPYRMERDGDSLWKMPEGDGEWLLRFAPTEVGEYRLKVVARDRSGAVGKEAGAIRCAASKSHGYVRVSRKDPRYFEFEDGTPYFAIGENVCWYRGQTGLTDYDLWFGHLAENGANFARIWMPYWAFGIEWGPKGVYRLDRATELDYVLRLAEEKGIYLKLCLENFRQWKDGPNPYDAANGGPCTNEMDIFTQPEAKRMFRNRLRYIVARWGYSPNVMGWELWNEINCVKGYQDDPQAVVDWTDEMCTYLKQIDPWRHLTTNSLGSCFVDDRYWELPVVDWAQVHGYYYFSDEMKREAVDMAAFVPKWLGRISQHGKPAMFAEFGLTLEKPDVREMCMKDTQGVHLHNGMWSAAMSGSCGGAMLWWWDSYVEPVNVYGNFRALASFTDGVPWTTAGFRTAEATASADALRVIGLQSDKLTLLWLQNKAHTWWNVVHEEPIAAIESATVTVGGLPDGKYAVEWWDTKAGKCETTQEATSAGGRLALSVPPLENDVAVKIRAQ